ncbi:RHS repeat-associated core domain-containing protein [Microbulbifer sp. 2201CG32-9]|uniref:RHS repeat-associated core domain-containing protein n=1 Tax=Microbulbifer sp. 2201CG32-9 TaxID=3232309 RepID=UPI00345B5C93
MKNRDKSFVPFNTAGKTVVNKSRRAFLKQSSVAVATTGLASLGIVNSRPARATEQSGFNRLSTNSMGFNGHRQDPVSGFYHLGNGYRVYNPGLMRFHAADSMSPFGRGGVNSYAYALGDPINLRDPSGHFALFSLLIGAIIGAVIGAVVSAAVEGIRAAATGDEFDFKQVFIGAALGFISGGFGAAAIGAKTGVQVGIAVADAVVSGAADFGLNVAAGSNLRDAGIGAGVGAAIGLVTFGLGKGVGTVVSKVGRKLVRQNNRIGFLLSHPGAGSKLASSTNEGNISRGKFTSQHINNEKTWHLIEKDGNHYWAKTSETTHFDISGNALEKIIRRNSLSDVHYYTGSHGDELGNNWVNNVRRNDLLDINFSKLDRLGFPYFFSNSKRKLYEHTFSSSYTAESFHKDLSRPGHHVLSFCYGCYDSEFLKFLRK